MTGLAGLGSDKLSVPPAKTINQQLDGAAAATAASASQLTTAAAAVTA